MEANLLDGDDFLCRTFGECKRSVCPGYDFREGVMSHVGGRFDLFLDEKPLRVVVVGQEAGLPRGHNAAQYSSKVSLQLRRQQVTQVSGLARRYFADDEHLGRNPHMRGTTSALRILFGLGLGTDFDREFIQPDKGRSFHIFEGFALVNRLLCSAGPVGTSQGRATPTMRKNCANHFMATMDILDPTMVILQGSQVAKSVLGMFAVTRSHGEHVHEASYQDHRVLLCTFSHPSARGDLRWGEKPDGRYVTTVVAPSLRSALRRL